MYVPTLYPKSMHIQYPSMGAGIDDSLRMGVFNIILVMSGEKSGQRGVGTYSVWFTGSCSSRQPARKIFISERSRVS